MTQEQYNTIVKVLKAGAPALAEDLITALTNVIQGYQAMAKELKELKAPAEEQKEGK